MSWRTIVRGALEAGLVGSMVLATPAAESQATEPFLEVSGSGQRLVVFEGFYRPT